MKPPPAPIRVPKAPISRPKGSSHKYWMGMSKRVFSFRGCIAEICYAGAEQYLAMGREEREAEQNPNDRDVAIQYLNGNAL